MNLCHWIPKKWKRGKKWLLQEKTSRSGIDEKSISRLGKIHKKFPNCEIVLISAKPSIARWSLKPQYDAINAAFKKYAEAETKITYANVWDIMLDEKGEVLKDIFIQDGLHMNKKGYDLWDKIIQPLRYTEAKREYSEEMEMIAYNAAVFFFDVFINLLRMINQVHFVDTNNQVRNLQ